MGFEYIRNYYGVPAQYGRIVEIGKYGKGVIVEDQGNYIGVLLDSNKPGEILTFHPTSNVKYLGMGKVREKKLTRSQRRYQEYLRSEYPGTFAEYIGCDYDSIQWKKRMGLYRGKKESNK